MPRRLTVVLLVAALGVLAGTLPAPSLADAGLSAPGGQWLQDSAGRRVELHGVNLVPKCSGGAVPAPTPGTPCVGSASGHDPSFALSATALDPARRFTLADARELRTLGFNAVRLGVIWEAIEPGPASLEPNDPRFCSIHPAGKPFPNLGSSDPWNTRVAAAYLGRVAATVEIARRAGLWVLLDMHQDAYGSAFANGSSPTPWNGEGAPPWATCTDSAGFGAPLRWQSMYTNPAGVAALGHFFANDVSGDLQDQYIRSWRAVAQRFRGNPAVIGYELYNEPFSVATPNFDRALQCFYAGAAAAPESCAGRQAPSQGLIPAIRSADPRALVFYEGSVLTDYGAPETIGIAERLPFRNLVLSFHVYGQPTLTQQQFSCTEEPICSASETAAIVRIRAERAHTVTSSRGGPAAVMTEFGAEDALADIEHVVGVADSHALSWFYWAAFQLHDPTGGPQEALLGTQTRRPVSTAKAGALAEPYPSAVAGVVAAQSYDPTSGRFSLSYAPDPSVHAPTLIQVPAVAYAHGAVLSVSGARVVSARGAVPLALVARPGVRVVQVKLRRR